MLATCLRRAARTLLAPPAHLLPGSGALFSVQIVVPALGDSISDGTIASVLKKSGDAVSENETIAQIETDKVTIDIKAPADGTLLGVVVQEQDTVVPGQLVATLDDAAAKAKLVGASPPAQPAADAARASDTHQAAAAAPAAAARAVTIGPHDHHHRVPGIRFPPRMTPDGRRISMLPASEAAAVLQQLHAAAPAPACSSSAAATPSPPAAAAAAAAGGHDASTGAFTAWARAQQRHAAPGGAADAPAAAGAPSKFATSVTRLGRMPPRRELSEKDMELIELGGAA